MKKHFNLTNIAVCALACAGMLTSCAGGKKSAEAPYAIKTFEDNPYLAEVWIGNDYDESVALETLCKRYNDNSAAADTTQASEGGACSSWHKDNFHGRNIDWTMKDFATVIVHMPKNVEKGIKYASVGLIAGNPAFTKDFIHNTTEIPENLRTLLPATVVDGMNECGVAINHNIVPYDGKAYEKNGELPSLMLCRYVLDHFATAEEAVEGLRDMTVTQAVVKIGNDYSHFMISDPTSTYVVEWIDGQFTATEFKADGNGNYISAAGEPAVMTNYFVGMAEKDGLATPAFYREHPVAEGVERAQIIMDQLPEAKTLEDHINICKSVWYSQFCKGQTQWYTENSGNCGIDEATGKAYWWYPTKENIHWMDNDDVLGAEKAMMDSPEMQGYYNDFNTNWNKCDPDNTYWYTQHSVVYDLKALKGYIIMQEGICNDKPVEITVE